jgi:methylenetetrahydrofolate--tRNA-(uracil-5-)-methyltransferase
MTVHVGPVPPLARGPSHDDARQRLRGAGKTAATKRALARRALADLAGWMTPFGVAAE